MTDFFNPPTLHNPESCEGSIALDTCRTVSAQSVGRVGRGQHKGAHPWRQHRTIGKGSISRRRFK